MAKHLPKNIRHCRLPAASHNAAEQGKTRVR